MHRATMRRHLEDIYYKDRKCYAPPNVLRSMAAPPITPSSPSPLVHGQFGRITLDQLDVHEIHFSNGPHRSGGQASIYIADHIACVVHQSITSINRRSGQRVALKKWNVEHLDFNTAMTHFNTPAGLCGELHYISAFDHPNIVKYLGYLDELVALLAILSPTSCRPLPPIGDITFNDYSLVMQCCRKSLGSIRCNRWRMTEMHIAVIMSDTLHGLEYMHGQGVLHCDIKMDNLLVDNNTFDVLICDFGHSQKIGHATSQGGTWKWVAPELKRTSPPNFGVAQDIFSVGRTAVECWRNRQPGKLTHKLKSTPRVIDFASSCVHIDPDQRMTISQALNHPLIVHNLPYERQSLIALFIIPTPFSASSPSYFKEWPFDDDLKLGKSETKLPVRLGMTVEQLRIDHVDDMPHSVQGMHCIMDSEWQRFYVTPEKCALIFAHHRATNQTVFEFSLPDKRMSSTPITTTRIDVDYYALLGFLMMLHYGVHCFRLDSFAVSFRAVYANLRPDPLPTVTAMRDLAIEYGCDAIRDKCQSYLDADDSKTGRHTI